MSAVIIPTHRCNLRCRHCLRSHFTGEFLDPDIHEKFVDTMCNYGIGKNRNWGYTGGEPTLHPHLDHLLKSFSNRQIKTAITTNGQFVPGMEKIIENSNAIQYIRISLDSPIPEQNDSVRGPGSFDQAIKLAKEYIKNDLFTILTFVLHRENISLMEQCFELGLEIQAHGVQMWTTQQWIMSSDSEERNKSLNWGDAIRWTSQDDIALKSAQRQLYNKYKSKFKTSAISDKFSRADLEDYWDCLNFSSKPGGKMSKERRIVLLPDGKISMCCDLYDVDYDQNRFDPNPFNDQPIDHILGDFTAQSIEEIIERKQINVKEILRRRSRDLAAGLLKNGRENQCSNCAYYHYQKPNK